MVDFGFHITDNWFPVSSLSTPFKKLTTTGMSLSSGHVETVHNDITTRMHYQQHLLGFQPTKFLVRGPLKQQKKPVMNLNAVAIFKAKRSLFRQPIPSEALILPSLNCNKPQNKCRLCCNKDKQ